MGPSGDRMPPSSVSATAESDAPACDRNSRPSDADPIEEFRSVVAGIRTAAAQYIESTADSVRAATRRSVTRIVLYVVAAVAALIVLMLGLTFLFIGTAQLLSTGFGLS